MQTLRRRNKTILVVEDEISLCELLEDELGAMGYRVVVASNGLEGLERLQEVEPDLIICDRAMPTMTGYELLERIRGIFPQYGSVPFIFLTALTDVKDRQAVQPLRPYAYLEKPLDFQVLVDTIEKAIG
jgi:CheY-like chemotaxis protein